MLEALYSVVHGETKHMVAASTFHAVMVDESTDVSNLCQMVIHLRCVNAGRVATRYGGIIAVEEQHATALREALEAKDNDVAVEHMLSWQ